MKMILFSLLLALTSQAGYVLDQGRLYNFDRRYLRLFPVMEFKNPMETEEVLAKKVGRFLTDFFEIKPVSETDLHAVLVQYISLNPEEMRKKIDPKRLDFKYFNEKMEKKVAASEAFMLDFFFRYDKVLIDVMRALVALALSKKPTDNLGSQFSQVLPAALERSYEQITKNEETLKELESQSNYGPLSDWKQRMTGLDAYSLYRYNTASTAISVISSIDSKLQKSEVSEAQEAQLLARCAKLVDAITRTASNDLPLLKKSFGDLFEKLREQRWASGIVEPSHRYMRWNAKLFAQVLAAGKNNKSLYKVAVNAARRLALGPGLLESPENAKLTELLSQILKQTNMLPAFGGPSTLANMKRLFYIDVLAHSPQTKENVIFESPVCQAEEMDRLLNNFAELIEISPRVLETRSIGSLFTEFPEESQFFSSLKDQEILVYLHNQLNAVYAFRAAESDSLTSLDRATVGQKFDLFLDNHREDPELNLEKFYPLIKVVNGYTNLAPSNILMEQKPFSEVARKFLASRLETLEFVPIRRGILAVFALRGPVYQRDIDSLGYLNEFKDITFESEVLLRDTPIAQEIIEPVITEKQRKNIVKVKAGNVSDDIIALLEKTPNAVESFRNPAITAGLDKNYEYTFGWVTRWDSPCKEEK